jgi:hypothetical protein
VAGTSAGEVLSAVREFADRASRLLAAPDVLRDSARGQLQVLNGAAVAERLRATPLTALKGRGLRIAALEQAGVRSVADVLDAPDHRLL